MSTTVTFAGNLTGDPVLGYTGDGKPYVTFRVMVDHRYQDAKGEWQEEEPTAHDVRVYGVAATSVADAFHAGHPVAVHGRLRTDRWTDQRTGEKHTRGVVEVNDYFGFVGAWVMWAGVRVDERRRARVPRAV